MEREKSKEREAVRTVVQRINDFWMEKRYEEIGECLSRGVIVAPPGSDQRIQGPDAYVASYREYDRSVQTEKFSPDEPEIDLMGDVAVALCPFYVEYRMEGRDYREKGRDMLVLSREDGEWKVIWRTMQTEPAVSPGDQGV